MKTFLTLAVTGSKFKSKVRSSKGLIPPAAAEETAAADIAAAGPRDEVEPITLMAMRPTWSRRSNEWCTTKISTRFTRKYEK